MACSTLVRKGFIKSLVNKIIVIILASIYGGLLAALAIMTCGGGDGIMLFSILFSSPFYSLLALGYSVQNDQLFGLYFVTSIPLLWIISALIATLQNKYKRRQLLKIFFACHYLGVLVPFFLSSTNIGMDKIWRYAIDFPIGSVLVFGPPAIYLVGQIWLWRQFRGLR